MKSFIVLFCLVLAACGSSPKTSEQKAADKSQEPPTDSPKFMDYLAPVEIGNPSKDTRVGKGQLYCGEGISQVPAQRAEIIILDGSRVVTKTTSDQYGKYSLVGKFIENKQYIMKIKSKCGSRDLYVSWRFELQGFADIILK